MKINRIYKNQTEAFNAIESGTFNASEENKRLTFIKNNIDRINKINNTEILKAEILGNNVGYWCKETRHYYCTPILYLDILLED